MKKSVTITVILLLASSMAACFFPGYKLKPDDKIGEMVISNDLDFGVPNLNEICTFEALHDGTCKIPASATKLGISTGWGEPTLEELDRAWLDSEWKMTFDAHKVDLAPFGTFDMDWEGMKVRVWNVAITNITSGEHTVRYDFHFENGSRPGNHAEVFMFTVVAADPTQGP
jgi:hypothetical protein